MVDMSGLFKLLLLSIIDKTFDDIKRTLKAIHAELQTCIAKRCPKRQ